MQGEFCLYKKSMSFRFCLVISSLLFLLTSSLILAGRLWAADSGTDAEIKLAAEQQRQPSALRGTFTTDYQFRTTTVDGQRESDNDLYEKLRIDYSRSPETGYEIHLFGTARQDLDGDQDRKYFFPFEDIGDTYSHWWSGQLYEAHIDFNKPTNYISQVRVGRQSGTRDEPIFFDGVAADFIAAGKLNVTVYGGVAVHFYEVNDNWGSDYLGGAGLDYSPFRKTMLSLDYLYVHDKRDPFLGSDQNDELISLKAWQQFGAFLRTIAAYRQLNNEPRDIKVRAIQAFSGIDVDLSLTYFRQFREQKELSNELSLYYDVIGTSDPFQSFDIKIRKFFGRHYALDLGYFTRDLIKDYQESAFNRKYRRAFVVFDMTDVFVEGLSFAILGEYWNTENKTEYTSAGLDATYRFKKEKKSASIALGTYYSLYKYDYYNLLGEREDVQTYYIKTKIPLSRATTMNARYEYEDSIENYHVLKIGVAYDF